MGSIAGRTVQQTAPRMQYSEAMTNVAFSSLLSGGDRRSVGRANDAASLAIQQPERFPELIACLWSEDPVIRMRAADAAEKASARSPGLLQPFKAELLGLLLEAQQQELRWHLAQMIPRLDLTAPERRRAAAVFRSYLKESGSLVRTSGLQALAELSEDDPRLRSEVLQLIEQALRTGTAAMKARARNLNRQYQRRSR